MRQDEKPLSTYYNELVAIFQEIDHRSTSQEETVEGVVQLHSTMTRLRVHIFLSGQEYQQRQTMGGHHPISEHSVMVANQTRLGSSYGLGKNRINQANGKSN